MNTKLPKIFLVCALGMCMSKIAAQSFSIDWHKIAGGGGTSTNGQYSLGGTIGQHDASGPMTGGSYSMTGGFWTIGAVQTPGAPILTIVSSNDQVIVFWPTSATGWTLQTNGDLGTTNWGDYLGAIVNNRATNSVLTGNLFFRLKQ